MKVLDKGYVKYIEHYGSDERVIESARQSTGGAFKRWGPVQCPRCHGSGGLMDVCTKCNDDKTVPGDEKLLRYMWENGHVSSFEFAGLVVEMKMPVFVARQIMRHWSCSFNEQSLRYVESDEDFYLPSLERMLNGGQSKTNKQASGNELSLTAAQLAKIHIDRAHADAWDHYTRLLSLGVAREIARGVLPVNTYTTLRMAGNLRDWLFFLQKRLPADVQWETRKYAEAIQVLIAEHFPRSHALFAEGMK